jgi:acyl-phosphate glycerol 3-phosphate acyltransferase
LVTIESILLVATSYLLGSFSSAYLVARWFGGQDLHRYGSGTISGSMVYEHVGRWAVVPVAVFDVSKAILPTWLGLYLGLGMPVAAAAGLTAGIGHNWPIFLRFCGGRGMGTFAGVLLVLFPWGAIWMGVSLGIGWRLGDSAPWLLVSLLTMPLLAHLAGGPEVVAPLSGAMILVALAKRLEANRRPLPPRGAERLRVILRRLLLDRDIASHREWIARQPDEESE